MNGRSPSPPPQQQPQQPAIGALLGMPPELEARFWRRRLAMRLASLDATLELCNAVMWLAILPGLTGGERALGKARLLLAAGQLAAQQLAPQAWWGARRSAVISAAQLARCALLLPWGRPEDAGAARWLPAPLAAWWTAAAGPAAAASQQQQQPQQRPGALMLLSSAFWGHLLFVLFHQQPVTVQAPLLAASAALQGAHLLASSGGALLLEQPGLLALSRSLHWAFEQLTAGFVGQLAPPPGGAAGAGGPSFFFGGGGGGGGKLEVLTTVLFLHLFGCLLLPLFLAYVVEWRLKVSFLLCAVAPSRAGQLRILTPAAAVVRGSAALSALLYLGWALLLAVLSWCACTTLAFHLVPP